MKVAAAILKLLDERGPGKSICPSDVARSLKSEGWRALMDEVREAAAVLADKGQVMITQRGKRVPPRGYKGPVRIARPAS